MHLAAALENVDALLRGDHRIAVEVCGPLLELGKILDRFQCPLRAEQLLDVHAAERWSVNSMTMLLGTDVADQMRRGVGVAIHVAVEAHDAAARSERASIVSLVELLLRERSHQEPQAFDLLRIENPLEQIEVVHDCDE